MAILLSFSVASNFLELGIKVCQDLYSTQAQNIDSDISREFKFLVI